VRIESLLKKSGRWLLLIGSQPKRESKHYFLLSRAGQNCLQDQ
jgi:hypothetical protein